MKLALFVDHEIGFLMLQQLLQQWRDRVTITAVVTSEENGTLWWPGVEALAAQHAIPYFRYLRDHETIKTLRDIDYSLLLSWKYIMKQPMLALAARGTVNLHYSLLPKYRGVYPVNSALIHGERETGLTFHRIGAEIDNGPILLQRSLPIHPADTARTLQQRLDELALQSVDTLLALLEKDEAGTMPVGEGSYVSRNDFLHSNRIDTSQQMTAGELINLMRGKTFLPHGKNAYIIDPETGKKVFLSLVTAEDN